MIERILANSIKRQSRATRTAIMLAVVAAFASIALLAISGWFLTGAALAGAGGVAAVRAFNYLLPSAAIRALAIARTLSRYGERLYSHRAALFALADVRPALFAKLAEADPKEALTRPPGEMAAQLGGDVDALEDSVIRKVTLPAAVSAAVSALFAAALSGWMAGAALVLGLAAMRWTARTMTGRMLPIWVQQRADAMAALKSAYADYAPCAADIAVYNLAPRVNAALLPLAAALDDARRHEVRAEAMIGGAQTLLATITVAAVLALADAGAAMAALSALAAAGATEIWAGLARNDMQRVRVRQSFVRLNALANLPPRTPCHGDDSPPSIGIADMQLKPGERLLLIGRSGAGKSRLLGTLIGLRADAPQPLTMNGQDVRQMGLEALRPQFAYAPQDAAIMAGSISDNLRLGRHGVTEDAMWDALTTACLADFVRGLPDGLNQYLGGDGARLSGGQRKRLGIARAVLAEKPWLVLDEPSEGLDAATEALLAQRLDAWLTASGRGLILVSHRKGMRALTERQIC